MAIEAKKAIDEGATILDVRTRGEFGGGAYPRAINIPVDELESRIGELPKNKPVVVYCRSGKRSALAAQILARGGFPERVINAGGKGDMP